jgi:hypothetical protein
VFSRLGNLVLRFLAWLDTPLDRESSRRLVAVRTPFGDGVVMVDDPYDLAPGWGDPFRGACDCERCREFDRWQTLIRLRKASDRARGVRVDPSEDLTDWKGFDLPW